MSLSTHEKDINPIQEELDRLEEELVFLDGHLIKPSQCYRFSTDPLHVMYNTNCPDHLMKKIEAIISKHNNKRESRS